MIRLICLLITLLLTSCSMTGTNPSDPYEPINRRIYRMNEVLDNTLLKPTAKVYTAVLPDVVRAGINNFYSNLNLLPTIANDALQAEKRLFVQDIWRLIINTSFGIGGIFDPASRFGLPAHRNDLGLTFAKWGDLHSPYLVLPFLGPSTLRDGMGLLFDYSLFSVYPYLQSNMWTNGLLVVRYIDLRAQLMDADRLMVDSVDPYAFMRDAYLQHRQYLITGETDDPVSLYVDEG